MALTPAGTLAIPRDRAAWWLLSGLFWHCMNPVVPAVTLGVVLFRNQRRQLEQLLASLESCRREPGTPAFRVRWLDNSEQDGTPQLLASLGLSDEIVIAPRNLGFGAGHNTLMRAAFSDPPTRFYICVNPDAILHPACVRELVAEAAANPRVGLVEALQFPDEHPKPYDPITHQTDWCSGCVLLMTRQMFEKVGGFDENLFLYCEDVDLSWRARAAAFEVNTAPRALVSHYTGDRAPGGHVAREMLRSGAYLADKWGAKSFGAVCRREYRVLTGAAPEVKRATAMPPDAARVADFAQMFHFAKVRW
jgi:GT2 family glycosyltransferase